MTGDWPRDEAPIESAEWIDEGENPAPEAEVLPAPAPRFVGPCALLSNDEVKPEHFVARVAAPEIARSAMPGQFVHVLCGPADAPTSAPLLRRPISISRAHEEQGWIEFLYRVVGEGTALLSHLQPGVAVDVMGPLGTPFDLSGVTDEDSHVLVGGGVGIPPMLFLAQRLAAIAAAQRIAVLLGGRTADLILCEEDFRALGVEPRIITDDGSMGRQGLVTELLDEALREDASARVYACGPVPMLRAVDNVCRAHSAPCQVSFEARMACGTGACLSCVIPTTTGYQRVCTEGPVFPSQSVVWTAELNLH